MTLPITPPGKSRITRLPYWETCDGLAGGSAGFSITSGATQFFHFRTDRPIKFSKLHISVQTIEGGSTVQPMWWHKVAGGLARLVDGGAIAVAGATGIQALDFGRMIVPAIGKDYFFALRPVNAGTLRLHTGANTVAISEQLTQFSPVGRARQKTASASTDASYITSDLAAALTTPVIWAAVIDGV